MSREVHVRFWESAEVGFLRATRLHPGRACLVGRADTDVIGARLEALPAGRVPHPVLVVPQRQGRKVQLCHELNPECGIVQMSRPMVDQGVVRRIVLVIRHSPFDAISA